MVAGGSGSQARNDIAGSGGGLKGLDAAGKGGTQMSGGKGRVSGTFGMGGGSFDEASGGGGGYFGGGSFSYGFGNSGGGGSSYISGYKGCISVAEDYTNDNPKFSTEEGQSIHYSGIKFQNPEMIDGKGIMPSPNVTNPIAEYGHDGNGHVIIWKYIWYEKYYIDNLEAVPLIIRVKCSMPYLFGAKFDNAFYYSVISLSI
ncbi:loricrin, putative [Trichomonas vaginalis G3]|uniref:receptor protein-tyrosine kinase n=1 Tax=Trichomonas vaginalis (strain ATCC PRA-98 / G3) TaxID=412133 RepID=A2FH90_TRIV3|nr:glycine-rich protein family [Trichomonas vaginalis G3]EAX95728.1 loricrin, putative [Trichomonas vaginalis G3]KAI5549314.1 glycine-rich protein family [Trichomonas vaginalis G3]|eukprot:XP_001308658.1 loricrin [Trichomonas vaginalis G3]